MKRKLTLSKETLRILDDHDLTRVVGGGGDSNHKNGHGKTGQHGSCNARSAKGKACHGSKG